MGENTDPSEVKLRNAILAISELTAMSLETSSALTRFIANKMPGLSQAEREELLNAVECDEKRIKLLKDGLATIQKNLN